MLLEARDEAMKVVVWRHIAPFAPSDFDEHRRMIERVLDDVVWRHTVFAVLEVAENAPPPEAAARRAIWQVLQRLDSTAKGFFVAPSALQRGALTAIKWLGLAHPALHAVATFDEIGDIIGADARERTRFAAARVLRAKLSP